MWKSGSTSRVTTNACLPPAGFSADTLPLTTFSDVLPWPAAGWPTSSARPAARANAHISRPVAIVPSSISGCGVACNPFRAFYTHSQGRPMRTRATMGAALLVLLAGLATGQDEQAKKVAEQKKAAEAAWNAVDDGKLPVSSSSRQA